MPALQIPGSQLGIALDMVLCADRVVHNQTWRFLVHVPRQVWEDFIDPRYPSHSYRGVGAAYELEKPFWDHLVEGCANRFSEDAEPDAGDRTRRYTVPDLQWLLECWRSFNSSGWSTRV